MSKLSLWLMIMLLSAINLPAQENRYPVSGVIKNERGETLEGASIKAENTATRSAQTTASDGQGFFFFSKLPAGTYIFIVSSVGYETDTLSGYTLNAAANISLSVTLKASSERLNDVVVVGYGKSSKRDITGAITTISSEEFNKGVISSPGQLLQGKVPGLNITKSGDPNGSPAVILRGPSTLREGGAQEPFYVIDGIPGASIDLVAPDDIVSIDVLKDASSTAIYGSRASNGVIIITTRRAKMGQTRLTYDGYVGVEKVSKRIDVLTGDELRAYLEKNGQSLIPAKNNPGANTNWQDEVQRASISHNHNIAFGGGTDKTLYGGSINYLDNPGIMKGTSLKRYILRANVEQKAFNDRLRLGLSLVNTVTKQQNIDGLVFQNMLKYLPTVNVRQPDGSYTEDFSQTRSYYNPVSLIENNIYDAKVKTFLGSALAEVKILKGLQYTLSFSMQNQQVNTKFIQQQPVRYCTRRTWYCFAQRL